MRTKPIVLSCVALFITGALISWGYHLYAEKKRDTQVCTATTVIYHNNVRASLTLDFMYTLKTQTGVVAVNGSYFKDDKLAGSVRRDVAYKWTENQDSFSFHSEKVNKIISDDSVSDEDMADVLPDFYVYPGKSITYSILPQGANSFMFTVGKRPVFLCYR